jgi:hypothetical protein
MGLALWVGEHPGLWAEDEEAYQEQLRIRFARVNATLRAAGLREHHEPARPSCGAPWWYHTRSYSIHHLRRMAAYVALGRGMPEPDLPGAPEDPVYHEYYRRCRRSTRPTPVLERQLLLPLAWPPSHYMVEGGLPFSHLMHQSDDGGDYVPIPFPEVLVPQDLCFTVFGDRVGSSYALREECRELAEQLRFPRDLELPELERIRDRAGEYLDQPGWERYAVESHVCQALLIAAERSIRSGCALRFG